MEPIASFSGLASGIDFRSLVDEIIRVESRPVLLLENRIARNESRTAAWGVFRGHVDAFKQAVLKLSSGDVFGRYEATSSSGAVSATASKDAQPGSYEVEVSQLATREKVGGMTFASSKDALGLAGEFRLNGVVVTVNADDSLEDIRTALNNLNIGSAGTGVSASILKISASEHRLILTANAEGADGIDLVDGSQDLLRNLGLVQSSQVVKHATANGAQGDAFSSSATPLATLLGFSAPPGAGTVLVAGVAVALDLSTMSLDDVAAAINSASIPGVTASVVTGTSEDGSPTYTLDIDGTSSFSDTNRILEALGVLEGDRGVGALRIEGNAFTDGNGTTTATTGTFLKDLWFGGSSAGVKKDDTLTITGTRGDGTPFNQTFTITNQSKISDLLTALNDPVNGFQAGARTATASLTASGSIMVTDDETGASLLDLTIVANNEGGGTLDFGTFNALPQGPPSEIVAGQDAIFKVDGNDITRRTNTVTDVIEGVTLNLAAVTTSPATVTVTRDTSGVADAVQDVVDAFNEIADFVNQQFSGAGGQEGGIRPPLSGESMLRTMRSSLRNALETRLTVDVGGGLVRMADIGVEVDREGRYTFDRSKLDSALATDPVAVSRLFGVFGSGSVGSLEYIGSSKTTRTGVYDVDITQLATRALALGSGFGGTYSDDGTADTLTITDQASGSAYSVSLADGMTLSQIVSALNTELRTAKANRLQASATLHSDVSGTAATDATLLQDLFDSGGASAGVADGDVITISGFRPDGTSVFQEFTVTDVATQTLGDLRASVAAAMGSGVSVSIENGALTVTDVKTGTSKSSLSLTSDNAGGGSLSFGTFDVATAGRGTLHVTASDNASQLQLRHDDYGSASGFDVSFTAGGADGTASLGLAAGSFAGLDVQGSVGGVAATGKGQILTGAEGTDMEGLQVLYDGTVLGAVGTMTFSRGVGSFAELAADRLLGPEAGGIDALVDNLDASIEAFNRKIEAFNDRLERRREQLIRRFSALEEALAQAQAQSQWLASQIAALTPARSGA